MFYQNKKQETTEISTSNLAFFFKLKNEKQETKEIAEKLGEVARPKTCFDCDGSNLEMTWDFVPGGLQYIPEHLMKPIPRYLPQYKPGYRPLYDRTRRRPSYRRQEQQQTQPQPQCQPQPQPQPQCQPQRQPQAQARARQPARVAFDFLSSIEECEEETPPRFNFETPPHERRSRSSSPRRSMTSSPAYSLDSDDLSQPGSPQQRTPSSPGRVTVQWGEGGYSPVGEQDYDCTLRCRSRAGPEFRTVVNAQGLPRPYRPRRIMEDYDPEETFDTALSSLSVHYPAGCHW
ncbi:hypothetical protein AAG570_003232 [Ranatra chinensis]|uniref:Uncharacterized protein n=1 Tax=Ranatra chinensis TaxID=642074 RepID=A0ABD0YIK5_9HEMI